MTDNRRLASRFKFSLLRLMLSISGIAAVLAIGRWIDAQPAGGTSLSMDAKGVAGAAGPHWEPDAERRPS